MFDSPYITGIFIVLIYRLLEFLFSGVLFGGQSQSQSQTQQQKQQQQQHGGHPGGPGHGGVAHHGGHGGSQPGHGSKPSDSLLETIDLKEFKPDSPQPVITSGELGWMNEAKDWAGELISGQTTTGRILVIFSQHFPLSPESPKDSNFFYQLHSLGCPSFPPINRLISNLLHRCIQVSHTPSNPLELSQFQTEP